MPAVIDWDSQANMDGKEISDATINQDWDTSKDEKLSSLSSSWSSEEDFKKKLQGFKELNEKYREKEPKKDKKSSSKFGPDTEGKIDSKDEDKAFDDTKTMAKSPESKVAGKASESGT